MKRGVLLFVVLILSVRTYSKEPTLLENVLYEMSKQFVIESLKEQSYSQLKNLAGEALAQEVASDIATTVAVLSLINSGRSYEDADSETQRYQAFMSGVASAATLVNPAAGGFVQLGVMAQGLAASLVSKSYALENAKLMAKIAEIEKKNSELIKEEFDAERNFFLSLIGRSVAIGELAKQNTDVIEASCMSDVSNLTNTQKCLQDVFLQLKLARLQEQTVLRIVTFSGRFISTSKFSKENIDKIQEELKTAMVEINKLENVIDQRIHSFVEKSLVEIKKNVQKKAHFYRCERLITQCLSKIMQSQKRITENKDPDGFDSLLLLDYTQDLQHLLKVSCQEAFGGLDTSIQAIAMKYSISEGDVNSINIKKIESNF